MFMTAIAQISNREPISCQVNDWITNSTQQWMTSSKLTVKSSKSDNNDG
jgi:hypothetical protein